MIFFKHKEKIYKWNIKALFNKGAQFLTVLLVFGLLSINFDGVTLWN